MSKCNACGKFLAVKVAAGCTMCTSIYHKLCVAMAESADVPLDWVCPDCIAKERKTDNSCTPVGRSRGANSSLVAEVAPPSTSNDSEVCAFRRELSEYMAEQREFRAEIRASLKSITDRMDEVERRLEAVERREAEAPVSGDGVDVLRQTVARLQQELSERDQDALLSDLDIGHIPEERGENVVHTVTVLAAKLGVSLEPRDVVFAERVGPGGAGATDGGAAGRPRRVVVRLARRQLRDDLLRAARVRRSFTSADAGLPGAPSRIYVNERLTRENRLLFHRVREECRKQHWRFAWTKRGRVYARQGDGKQAFPIRSDADFLRVFGPAAV